MLFPCAPCFSSLTASAPRLCFWEVGHGVPTWRSLDTSAESSVTPNSLCCSPTSEPLAAVLAPLLSCSSGFASHSSLALAPSLRLRWDGSRWPSCRAGGWQPLSLHLTCPGLLAGVLLCELAAPARWQPCRHPADSVLSLCSTSGLHPRSLPRCAGACLQEPAWLSPAVPFTCSAPPASDRSRAGHTLRLHTRTSEPA